MGARPDPAGGLAAAIGALRPMLAVPGRPADLGPGWRHEIKWDGVRALVTVDGGRVHVRSRTGGDVTARYPELQVLTERVSGRIVLDGEIVAFGPDGAASFAQLQRRMHLVDATRVRAAARGAPVHLVAFDLLVAGEEVLLDHPLEERRGRLAALGLHGGAVQVPPDSDDAVALLGVARTRGEEGIVSKRVASPYRPGVRSADWVKLPFSTRTDVVVGAYRPETGGGSRLGAVIVGAHDGDGRLHELGGVGSGLAGRAGERLRGLLVAADGWPFAEPSRHADARAVRPVVVGTVRHHGWTAEGRLRQPVWVGTRDDVEAADVELPARPGPSDDG